MVKLSDTVPAPKVREAEPDVPYFNVTITLKTKRRVPATHALDLDFTGREDEEQADLSKTTPEEFLEGFVKMLSDEFGNGKLGILNSLIEFGYLQPDDDLDAELLCSEFDIEVSAAD